MTIREEIEVKVAEYEPEIKRAAIDILAKSGQSIDEYGAEKLFGKIHGLLPLAIRVVIRRPRFVDFCIHNQDRLMSFVVDEDSVSKS